MTDMKDLTLYGAAYSVYVRIARLALAEKGLPYRLVEVDVFSAEGVPDAHMRRHPFGRIPVLEHGEFGLYETNAIVRYVDEAFAGPNLQPEDPVERARANQIIGIMDSYAYRTLVWDIYVERVVTAREGRAADEAKIVAALPRASICLTELDRLASHREFLVGSMVTLADVYAAPMFAYFLQAPEACALLNRHEKLRGWWSRIAVRESMKSTES